jgi:hypothetical protein
MAKRDIAMGITVRDNGVRSFVPPNYCFELVDSQGNVVDVVSEVVIEESGEKNFDAISLLLNSDDFVTGYVEDYDPQSPSGQQGLRLVVSGLHMD